MDEPGPGYGRLVAGGILGAVLASGAAVLVALQLAKPDIPEEALRGGDTPTEAPSVAAVANLSGETGRWTGDPGTWKVTLTWDTTEGAVAYAVSRDGRSLDETTATTLADSEVTPEAAYAYSVVAVDASGAESDAAKVRVQTGKLPKGEARVDGRWVLSLKVESSTVGAGAGKILVSFDPVCPRGPCDVRWTFTRPKVANEGTARAKAGRYRGTGSGGMFTRDCRGNQVSGTRVAFDFHVTTAHTVGRAWRATKIEGTLTESVPAVSGCLSARNVWSFEGSVQG